MNISSYLLLMTRLIDDLLKNDDLQPHKTTTYA